MLEVAEIFRLHGAAYRARVGNRLLPSQARAVNDIQACRTAYFGGHVDLCDHCGREVYVYHSCGNRSCPKCHREQTERWIDTAACPSVAMLGTICLPLRCQSSCAHLRLHTRKKSMACSCAGSRLPAKARPRSPLSGRRLGCLAVLHTWTRAMQYHPHVHFLVTAGGLSADGSEWLDAKAPRLSGSSRSSVGHLPR